jgi:hypothetical protein
LLRRSGSNFHFTDLSDLPPSSARLRHGGSPCKEALRPFDFSRGPMLRASLLRLGDEEHVLSLTMHHIVSDGWSMGVLVHEFAQLYTAFSSDRHHRLLNYPYSTRTMHSGSAEWLSGEVLAEQLTYWKQQLDGAPPVLELPTDRPRPAVQSFKGGTEVFTLSKELV